MNKIQQTKRRLQGKVMEFNIVYLRCTEHQRILIHMRNMYVI